MLCGDIRKIMPLTQLRLKVNSASKGKKNRKECFFFFPRKEFSKSHISREKKA